MPQPDAPSFPHQQLTERMIGTFYAVHRELGYGFSEVIYQRALVIALNDAGLRAKAAVPIDVWFRGRQIGHFLADIVVEDTVLLELKAADDIDGYVQCSTTSRPPAEASDSS